MNLMPCLAAATLGLLLSGCNIGDQIPDPRPGAGVTTGYANASLTPGATNKLVKQSNIDVTVCNPGWTATVRPPSSYTQALERKQLKLYGYKDQDPTHYTMDHLLALEIGGDPVDPRNLFPQPERAAKDKDRLEHALHRQVCDGAKTLAEAQHDMLEAWRR